MELFFERAQNCLKNQKMSQHELARKLNVSHHTVWIWLHVSFPPLERFREICACLKANPAYLLGLED